MKGGASVEGSLNAIAIRDRCNAALSLALTTMMREIAGLSNRACPWTLPI